MQFYTKQHPFYCGIDLHTQNMYICIVNQEGKILLHRNLKTDPSSFLRIITPYLSEIVVTVECMFTWYWIADFCADHNIKFVLGHALYMKAIHGSKTKNDKIDSKKLALLLRAGMIPMAYVYPAELRSTRDLLRRRMFFMHKRSELLGHIQNTKSQYNLPDFQKKIAYKANRNGIAEQFSDTSTQQMISMDLTLLDHFDEQLQEVELYLDRQARRHAPNQLFLLRTVPGIGKILALVILYEVHDIHRFPTVQRFSSYARLISPQKMSNGKVIGRGQKKMGNAYLKWAFSEAATLMLRSIPEVKKYHEGLKTKHGKAKAMAILSHRIGRAVYHMLKHEKAFDVNYFLRHSG